MNQWNIKLKAWRDRHSKVKENRTEKSVSNQFTRITYENGRRKETICAPKIFSFVDNPEETMEFIEAFVRVVENNKPRTSIHVDSRFVKHVTVDALIYLLAAIDNSKGFKHHNYSASFPKDKRAKKIYHESGFVKYFTAYDPKNDALPSSTRRMKIERGMKNDPKIAGRICDFVRESLKLTDRQSTGELYKVLIELLSNAYWHAYENDDFLKGRWYIYAEHIDTCVRIVFADTGKGIPETVRKNFFEKAGQALNAVLSIDNDAYDSRLIMSALRGEFRTRTNEGFRGNGLDTVRRQAMTDKFLSFEVISGRGKCSIGKDTEYPFNGKRIYPQNFRHRMYGTLYTFDVCGGQ